MINPNERSVFSCDLNAVKQAETRGDLVGIWKTTSKQFATNKLSEEQLNTVRKELCERARELGLPVKDTAFRCNP